MKVLVCGGRDFDDWKMFTESMATVCNTWGKPTKIIHGDAKGADFLARVWAKYCDIEQGVYPADWNTHGRCAGHIRNKQMLDMESPSLVVAFPGGRGTADMVNRSIAAGIWVIQL